MLKVHITKHTFSNLFYNYYNYSILPHTFQWRHLVPVFCHIIDLIPNGLFGSVFLQGSGTEKFTRDAIPRS